MIALSGVSKIYNRGKPSQFTAVDDISLNIARGGVTVLKGPSGSGKTTLLTLIGCMARPTSGRITLEGIATSFHPAGSGPLDISSLPERFLTEIRRNAFGFIFQQFNLIRGISVLENVMLPLYPAGRPHTALRQQAERLLVMLRLDRQVSSPVEWLSGGELQRAAIARALINDPQVIIADEPTAHLDSRLSREFMEIAATLAGEGKTVLIASHDPIVFESDAVTTRYEMRDGRLALPA